MHPQTQKFLVQDHIATLHAEAKAHRLAASARPASKARQTRRPAAAPRIGFDVVRWFMARFAHAG